MNSEIVWQSEENSLPNIAQPVFLAYPRKMGEFWDVYVARILVRYEGVCPIPVKRGTPWPTDYWWGAENSYNHHILVTGNSWWAPMNNIALPPHAEHRVIRGDNCIVQTSPIWVGQKGFER
jgi:hypothetical protein